MADDLLLSPEEQDERARQWLKDNGISIIVGIALGLGAIFGYGEYKKWKQTKAEQASSLYAEVLQKYQDSELNDLSSLVEQLKAEHASSSYAAKAILIYARQLSVNDLSAAATELEWVRDHADEIGLAHAARIRLAKVYLQTGEFDKARSVAEQQPRQGYDSYYEEILGDIAIRTEDLAAAHKHYSSALENLGESQQAYRSILELKIARSSASLAAE